MPIYNYKCSECDARFTQSHMIADRKIPEEQICPECGADRTVTQVIGTPNFVTDSKSTLTRAGGGWQDVLKKVKKASGRDNSIHD